MTAPVTVAKDTIAEMLKAAEALKAEPWGVTTSPDDPSRFFVTTGTDDDDELSRNDVCEISNRDRKAKATHIANCDPQTITLILTELSASREQLARLTAETSGDLVDACPICAVKFSADDMCLTDIEMGICHAACLEGSPMVDLETGEPLPEGAPPPTPYRYVDEREPIPPSKADAGATDFNPADPLWSVAATREDAGAVAPEITWQARALSAEAQVATKDAALKPFAVDLNEAYAISPDSQPFGAYFTLGDIRRARSSISTGAGK